LLSDYRKSGAGACVNLGGSLSLRGGQCVATCDGPNDFVLINDAKGCLKLVDRTCADASADPVLCF